MYHPCKDGHDDCALVPEGACGETVELDAETVLRFEEYRSEELELLDIAI